MTGVAIETHDIGKRFGHHWAVRNCSIEVPEGRVCGLVGANGAGKTTLIRMLAGLSRATEGAALVNGMAPADAADFLRDIGYLAQEVPLYRRWTAADHLAMGAAMNERWDASLPLERLKSLDVPLDRRIEALSGGMRAQVALAVAMGKRPKLLLLDEPVAALDPLARREFLGSLASAMTDGELTVLLSSHLLPDLERVCDHWIVMSSAHSLLAAGIDEIHADHKRVTVPVTKFPIVERQHEVLSAVRTPREVSAVVKVGQPILDPEWQVDELGLEDVVLAYLEQGAASNRLERGAADPDGPATALTVVGGDR